MNTTLLNTLPASRKASRLARIKQIAQKRGMVSAVMGLMAVSAPEVREEIAANVGHVLSEMDDTTADETEQTEITSLRFVRVKAEKESAVLLTESERRELAREMARERAKLYPVSFPGADVQAPSMGAIHAA